MTTATHSAAQAATSAAATPTAAMADTDNAGAAVLH